MGGIWAADPYPNIDVGFQIPGVEGSGDPLRIPTVGMWSKLLLNRGAPDGSRRGAVRAPDNRSPLESGETYAPHLPLDSRSDSQTGSPDFPGSGEVV